MPAADSWPSERTIAIMQNRIESLDRALQAQTPPLTANFKGPASRAAIEKAETRLGVNFPKELKAYLLCANGQKLGRDRIYPSGDIIVPQIRFRKGSRGLSAWGQFLQLHKIVEFTRCEFELDQYPDDDLGRELIGPVTAHHRHIIISMADDPCSIGVDLQPGEGGRVGQIVTIEDQPDYTACIAPSLSSFLRLLADGYLAGRFQRTGFGTIAEK